MRQSIWERRADLIRPFHGSGKSSAEVAQELGLHPITVKRYAKRFGFDIDGNAGRYVPVNAITERVVALSACCDRGLSRKEAATELGLKLEMVSRYSREFDIPFPHGKGGQVKDASRDEAMAAMYANGKTLAEIGGVFGITRERVRQIIKKRHGLSAQDGGQSVKAARTRANRQAKKDAKTLRKYGCTYAQYRSMIAIRKEMLAGGASDSRTPTGAWHSQRRNAINRGIEWNISLWDWWQVWQQSGKWDMRGREKGQYVMCRFEDTGPYELGNVYIATCSHNCSVRPHFNARMAELREERAAA